MQNVMTGGQTSNLIRDHDTILITDSGGGVLDPDFVCSEKMNLINEGNWQGE